MVPLVLLGAALHAPAAATTPVTSFVTMASENGDYIGAATNRLWYTGAGSVGVTGSVSGQVNVNVSGGPSGDYFTLTFAAAPGDTLAAGQYINAQRTPFRTAGHPGIDIYGSGRGCNTTSGTFKVIDVAPDLSRLWLTYEQHCEGGEPALFGEVRYNEPGIDPDLLVVPDQISWPTEFPGVAGRLVPVTVVNTGTAPVTVSTAAITAGASDFAVAANNCSTIAIGAFCVVTLRFDPSTGGDLTGTLTLTDSTTTGTHTVALSGTGVPGHTSWALHSETGDPVGGGNDFSYAPANATFSASGNSDTVQLSIPSPSGSAWTAVFRADGSTPLTAGKTFSGATAYSSSSNATPGMSVHRTNGLSCSTVSGSFTVHEASFDLSGALTKFSVSFEQHCNGAGPALFGSIAWMADNPAVALAPDVSPPPAVTGLVAYPSIASVVLNWTDPSVSDWSDAVIRGVAGDVAPASITSGFAVSDGRAGGVVSDGYMPGTDFTFAAFPRDYAGNIGPRAAVTVRGTSVSLSGSPAAIPYGGAARMTGRLLYSHNHAGVPGEDVFLYGRVHGSSSWEYIADQPTRSDGSYGFVLYPRVSADYEIYFYGDTNRFGTTAGPVVVTVAPKVSATLNRTRGPLGTTFVLTATVAPRHAGQRVLIQRYLRGGWHTIATRVLNSSSKASFSVRPGTRGTYDYRVVKPADSDHAPATSRTVTLTVT
jgi:hypothetical protein